MVLQQEKVACHFISDTFVFENTLVSFFQQPKKTFKRYVLSRRNLVMNSAAHDSPQSR